LGAAGAGFGFAPCRIGRLLGELGEMRGVSLTVATIFLLAGTPFPGAPGGAVPPAMAVEVGLHDVAARAATARRAGLRVVEGRRLVLATDRPVREGDGVADLPAVFDQAFATWCAHFGIAPESLPDWRCFGCLMVDREAFRAAGLLPDTIPAFRNGFCARNLFWLIDQSNPAYRRHLLLHEGVHAFTITVRDLDAPPWYTEGIAEYLATHRLEPDPSGVARFVSTPLPDRPIDVEQLGRIETLRRLRDARAAPSLADVFTAHATGHHDIPDYAASWAAVALLARHPTHAATFAAAERGPLDAAFTTRLEAAPGWDAPRAARDFAAFIADIDYGWDVARMAIDWSPGKPLTKPVTVTVAADRGWQNTGLVLEAGHSYTLAARGRCRIGTLPDTPPGATTTLESEAEGISLRWYRGRPIGRLIAAEWIEDDQAGPEGFVVLAEGARGEFTARVTGPLYLKINEAPGELTDNEGSLDVEISPNKR
jgi:hypothetical protein